jgi:hypothetical protein
VSDYRTARRRWKARARIFCLAGCCPPHCGKPAYDCPAKQDIYQRNEGRSVAVPVHGQHCRQKVDRNSNAEQQQIERADERFVMAGHPKQSDSQHKRGKSAQNQESKCIVHNQSPEMQGKYAAELLRLAIEFNALLIARN